VCHPLKDILRGEVREFVICTSLKANSTNYLALGTTRLILQEKIVFEESKMGRNSEVNLTKVNKDDYLED
jgi:hypothetical protein